MKDIKFGAYAPLVDYRLARQAAIAAEQSGFDFLCFGDSVNMSSAESTGATSARSYLIAFIVSKHAI